MSRINTWLTFVLDVGNCLSDWRGEWMEVCTSVWLNFFVFVSVKPLWWWMAIGQPGQYSILIPHNPSQLQQNYKINNHVLRVLLSHNTLSVSVCLCVFFLFIGLSMFTTMPLSSLFLSVSNKCVHDLVYASWHCIAKTYALLRCIPGFKWIVPQLTDMALTYNWKNK